MNVRHAMTERKSEIATNTDDVSETGLGSFFNKEDYYVLA